MKPADLPALLHEAQSCAGYRKSFVPLVKCTLAAATGPVSFEAGPITGS